MKKLELNNYNSDNNDSIKHLGFISKITETSTTVSLKENINCSSCKAKSACGVSEEETKEIEIFSTNPSFSINEPVTVVLEKKLGLKAVFWAYFFPFILILTVLIISSIFFKEWIAGLLSIFVLIPYYLILYFSKDSFKKTFNLSILKHSYQ